MKGTLSVGLIRDLGRLIPVALIAVVIGGMVNLLRESPLPWIYQPMDERLARSVSATPLSPVGDIPLWDVAEALEAFEEKRRTFVDAREEAFFQVGRIPGAIALSPRLFRKQFPEFAARVERNQPILVYCSDADCSDAAMVAGALRRLGYSDTSVLSGGWEEWTAAELPQEP